MADLNEIKANQRRLIARAFAESFQFVKDSARINELTALIEAGDYDSLVRVLGIDSSMVEPLRNSIEQAYREGGLTGAEQVGRIPVENGSVLVRFDMTNQRAIDWLRNKSSTLVTEIVGDQREMIRSVISEMTADGVNPRRQALSLVGRIDRVTGKRTGGFIGLTSEQSGWVTNARRQLENLDPDYLTRELRDKRFDSTIIKAIETEKPLTLDQIDNAINNLQNRTLKYRADVVSRTESINALRAGQHEAVTQAAQTGEIDEQDATKTWDASGDGRTRYNHAAAEGQVRQLSQPFTVGGYSLMYPGDSSMGAPGSETIQCRCIERIELDFAGQLKRIEGF